MEKAGDAAPTEEVENFLAEEEAAEVLLVEPTKIKALRGFLFFFSFSPVLDTLIYNNNNQNRTTMNMKYIYFNEEEELSPYQLRDEWRTDQIAIAKIDCDKEEEERTIQLLNQAYDEYGPLNEIGIIVVSHPDYHGGRQNKWYFFHEFPYPINEGGEIEFPSVFEYISWAGTLEGFIIENPEFEDHWEPNRALGTERKYDHPTAQGWLKEKLDAI